VGHFVPITKRRTFNHKEHEGTPRKTLPLMTRIALIYTDRKYGPEIGELGKKGLGHAA
jgi:hypothetical protein